MPKATPSSASRTSPARRFNDTLEGNSGTNVLAGGAGIDTVSYQHALAGVTVSLALTTAQNTLGAGTDTLSGFEHLIGSAFNDTLIGDRRRQYPHGVSPATTRYRVPGATMF